MLKKHEITKPDSCLNQSGDDEPVFVLCGRDKLASITVLFWAMLKEAHGGSPHKIQTARDHAELMERWFNGYNTQNAEDTPQDAVAEQQGADSRRKVSTGAEQSKSTSEDRDHAG